MPANKKYLTVSVGQRCLKISAAILGGYLVVVTLHMAIALWFPYPENVIVTMAFSLFILWVTLMIIPFLFKNGWIIWGIYLFATLFFYGVSYLGQIYNPIVL